ncbi:MAG: hypothetical protein JNL60_09680 [Bacteroidia bacterium]|nr:hypothetical protein [Bacteroidia bacterium]
MKKIKLFLYISLALNIGFAIFLAGKWIRSRTAERVIFKKADNWDAFAKARADVYKSLPARRGNIAFVGTSLTEGFPLTELFPDYIIDNRGIGGNETSHMLSRISDVAKTHPLKLFLEAGINDVKNGLSVDSIMRNYKHIVGIMKKQSPETQIYLQSIMPTSHSYLSLNNTVRECNAQIEEFSRENKYVYIHLYEYFSTDNILTDSLTYDGLHLNAKGYKLWSELIAKEL